MQPPPPPSENVSPYEQQAEKDEDLKYIFNAIAPKEY